MKKIIIALAIFLMSSVQAQEAQYNIQNKIDISSDKVVSYSQNLSINNDFIFKYDVNVEDVFDLETYKISLQDKGYTVEPLATNETAGILIRKDYPKLELVSNRKKITLDLSKPEEGNLNDEYLFQVKKGIIHDKYVGKFTFDYSNFLENKDISKSELKKLFNLTFELNLPSKALKYDATSTNDELTYLLWNLAPGEKNEVNFEFKVINITRLAIFVIIGFIIVGGIIILLVKKASNKIDEISDQIPKKEKKEKKKKEPKKIYTNGMLTDEQEKQKAHEEQQSKVQRPQENLKKEEKKVDLMAPIKMPSTNTPTGNNKKVDLMAAQDMSKFTNNQQPADNKKVDLMAPIKTTSSEEHTDDKEVDLMAPMNTPSYNKQSLEINRKKIDLMAAQDMSSLNNNPVEPDKQMPTPMEEKHNLEEQVNRNNVNSDTPDYTNIFNQYYDQDKKGE